MMKGLELAEAYYKAYGQEMLQTEFPQAAQQAAVGLVVTGRSAWDLTMKCRWIMTMVHLFVSGCRERYTDSTASGCRRLMKRCRRNLWGVRDV